MRAGRLAAAVAVAAAAALGVADPALAQADDLGERVISSLPGYEPDIAGIDGPLDAGLLTQMGLAGGAAAEEAEAFQDAIESSELRGFVRTFGAADGTVVFVMAFGPLADGRAAGGFTAGVRSQLADVQDVPSPNGDDRIEASSGSMVGLGDVLVAGIESDDLLVMVLVTGPRRVGAFDDAVTAQAALSPPTGNPDDGETAAYRAGRVLGLLLVIAVPIGLVVLYANRRGRGPAGALAGYPAPPPPGPWGQPPPPGAWGPPPQAPPVTMPWGASPPPPAPQGSAAEHDPWAPRFPTAPPTAPPAPPPSDEGGPAPIE